MASLQPRKWNTADPAAPQTAREHDYRRWDHAFARAAGAAASDDNAVRLLLDAAENFPAWLDAIDKAEHYILFESYLFLDDPVGRKFAEALRPRPRRGCAYAWSSTGWVRGRQGALGTVARRRRGSCRSSIHRASTVRWPGCRATIANRSWWTAKSDSSAVSASTAAWEGDPAKRLEPWRDTGVEIRGPAVAELEQAFAQIWAACDEGPLGSLPAGTNDRSPQGNVRVHVVAGVPGAAGIYRLDLLLASVARKSAVADRRVLRGHVGLYAGTARGGGRWRRRALARARRVGHPRAVAIVARRLSAVARRRRARLRMERHDAARQDCGGRRHVDARRLDQSQSRELDVQLRTRRGHRG